jgi:hypothetical protein
VFAQIDHAFGKRRVLQPGHGDQKMMRQVDGGRICGHNVILKAEHDPLPTPHPAG